MSTRAARNETIDAFDQRTSPPSLRLDDSAGEVTMVLSGAWVLAQLAEKVPRPPDPGAGSGSLRLDGAADALDSAGALAIARYISRWEEDGWSVDVASLPDSQRRLISLLKSRLPDMHPPAASREGPLARLGRATVGKLIEANAFLAFIGELVSRGGRLLLLPWRIRWRQVIAEIEAAGLRALGIVGLLSFLVGMVMAYQAGATLQDYGANVLIVNLVGIITLREMGPLLTAIIVAGRTGSSYTAQIGTMRITEEIDALRAIGIPPFDMLILPKVIALILVMPLLTVFANLMGLLGGAVVAAYRFEVSFAVYFDRLPEVVNLTTLMLGLVKMPVFAVVIALIGCMQGMRVAGSALAVGRATTVSVVQATFLVIVIDAVFSVLFNLLGY
ncbi:ABC transporter permease [Guyparkeria hydrothermalis]|uniref:MlaE family ABC transporter permease n=1 Tax=Guyparkeria hydrothermalis TaxID=923 RepID=UPI0020215C6A|nr:ABC transporter permease [Guyparkeria hydrothermalis]MCL7743781.1 ABC transporter permease [Guyparkeria hydrothermalis]